MVIIINTLEHVFKNIRYKLLHVDDKYYIYDADRLMWSSVFPFIYWFIPHTVYQIDKATYEKLQIPDEKKRSKSWLIVLVLGVSVPLGRVLASFTDQYVDAMPYVFMTIMFVIFIAISVSFRLLLHRSRKRKIHHKTELNELSKQEIKIRPATLGGYFQALFLYFFFLCLSVFAGFLYAELQDFLAGICFAVFVFMFLLTNSSIIPQGPIKVTYIKNRDEC